MTKIQLTQTVQKSGCAAKVEARELREVLSGLRFPPTHPQLLVDGRNFDDAAIYQVSPEMAMVQTLDFFTPIVDSPFWFGQIAAANSLSDVYAMGGIPKTCMGILAYPVATMDRDIISEVMQGACDKIAESGATLVGGHSIDDDTLKFGLSVTGFVSPERIWKNQGAKVGDLLILTKALGTGTSTAALKRRVVDEGEISEVLKSMAQLNHIKDLLNPDDLEAIHAATDITGFGMTGHSYQMAKASGVKIKLTVDQIPRFSRAEEFLNSGFLTKAHRTNDLYTEASTHYQGISKIERLLVNDPQTSGGLLLSVKRDRASGLIEKLKSRFPLAAIIGSVEDLDENSDGRVGQPLLWIESDKDLKE